MPHIVESEQTFGQDTPTIVALYYKAWKSEELDQYIKIFKLW